MVDLMKKVKLVNVLTTKDDAKDCMHWIGRVGMIESATVGKRFVMKYDKEGGIGYASTGDSDAVKKTTHTHMKDVTDRFIVTTESHIFIFEQAEVDG